MKRRLLDLFRLREPEPGVRLAHPRDADPLQPIDSGDAAFEAEWRPLIKRRFGVLLVLLIGWGAAIEARLVYLQVIRHEELARQASSSRNG